MTQPLLVLTWLLFVLLGGGVVGFVILGLRHRWRRRRLAMRCMAAGLEFVPNDPFNAPRYFCDFALMSAGHSPRAQNVSQGRAGGARLRAFDFGYEVGHGIRRSSRQYTVLVLEGEHGLKDVLMWHRDDAGGAPLQAAQAESLIGPWVYGGDAETAARLARACEPLATVRASLQVIRGVLMICAPAMGGETYERLTAASTEVCETLGVRAASGGAI
jgi:hypothetical protein